LPINMIVLGGDIAGMSQRHWDLVSILSPLDPPRRDRPTRQISDFSPIYPDHAL